MLVISGAKALVLKLRDPSKVFGSISTAKHLNYEGNNLVVVPHRIKETLALRNLGIKAPSPMLSYYEWAGNLVPYEHQKMTSAFLSLNMKALVFNQIGTGKTQSALWTADYLMNLGMIKKCLILSPLSTLERVWGDAIYMSFPERKGVVLHGTAIKRKNLLEKDFDFYIINHDGFKIISEAAMNMFDLVIVDEAAVLRNPSTTRSKMFRKWVSNHKDLRLWLLTGTPTPNGPQDAWVLSNLVGNANCTRTFGAFKDLTMMRVSRFKFIPRPEAPKIVKDCLQPAVMYKRDECLDLPITVYQTRKAALSAQQTKHYKEMYKKLMTEIGQEERHHITAVNEAVKMQKLLQISGGVAYGPEGDHIELDCAPRITLTKEIIEEIGGKAIVFTPLIGIIHMLYSKLKNQWDTAIIFGNTPRKKRDELFRRFQSEDTPVVLIAHPKTMAHGLTLTAAQSIIWYGPITSNDIYTQANGRVERIGKRHVANIIHIEATELEHVMFQRLRKKQAMQGVLLDYIQQQMR